MPAATPVIPLRHLIDDSAFCHFAVSLPLFCYARAARLQKMAMFVAALILSPMPCVGAAYVTRTMVFDARF